MIPAVHAAPAPLAAYTSRCCRIRGAISSRLRSASGRVHLEMSAVFVAPAPDPVAEHNSRFRQCQWQGTLREARFVRGASCSRTCSISANGKLQILYVVRFLPETLRRHFLLSAVASSRDVAASLSQTAVAAAERCRAGPLCRALGTRETILEAEEEGRLGESHLALVR